MYHVVSPALSMDEFKDGRLLQSALALESLNKSSQYIGIFRHRSRRFFILNGDEGGCTNKIIKPVDMVTLNWHAPIESGEIEASNGFIHTVSSVIPLPDNLVATIEHFPAHFKLLEMALRRTGMDAVLHELHAVTMFAPTNVAFMKLGVSMLKYLFSDSGIPALTNVRFFFKNFGGKLF